MFASFYWVSEYYSYHIFPLKYLSIDAKKKDTSDICYKRKEVFFLQSDSTLVFDKYKMDILTMLTARYTFSVSGYISFKTVV